MKNLYEFPCEYCTGTVRERIIKREPISHFRGIVILENAPIGVCDKCGAHYYAADVMTRAESVLKSETADARTVQIPIASY